MAPNRPSPEHFLQRARAEERLGRQGKLKIYLGAAPGVGKTHEMLHDAFAMQQQGLDVVVGLAETHGREEITSFLDNFEILPRQAVNYREKTYYEFDLDGALQRHPGLILVDELAHTNPPGLRHNKRWQDIKELLDRGIDVYTTLNVQHIESLKDSVAQIIQAQVQETIPDSIIERAHTIELIDLPPEDLLRRLEEGKVYIPKQAEFAREHFFRKGNLIALRELALRVTAERVGTDVLWYRQDKGVKEIWRVKDKILVCVGPNPEALKLIRAAKKLATNLQAQWLAVYIDVPQQSPEIRAQAIQNLGLAELLGAETHVLYGVDMVKEILRFAHEQNVTQIMIWKHIRTRFRDWFYKNLTDEIVRQSGEIDVYVMTGKSDAPRSKRILKSTNHFSWSYYLLGLVTVTVLTLFNFLLATHVTNINLIMVYLLGVTFISLLGQRGPAIITSILSVFAYDFFFIQPLYSFAITDIQYFITLIIMLFLSQIISNLTLLIRSQAEAAQYSQHQTTSLYAFSRQLTRIRGIKKILAFGVEHLGKLADSEVLVLMPIQEALEVQANYPPGVTLDEKDYSIAKWVYDMGQPAGLGTNTLSLSDALFLPLLGSLETIGVLKIKSLRQTVMSPEQKDIIESCVNQLSLAIEIELLHERGRNKEIETERNRARTLLLASIYHDLAFPLNSVIHVINRLRKVKSNDKIITEQNIDHEIKKLTHLNSNLYQMIELEYEGVILKKVLCSLQKIIEEAITIVNETIEARPIELNIPNDLPMINVDHKYIQDVFIQLLDNAIKFSTPKSIIYLSVKIKGEKLLISIEDFGLEVDIEEQEQLFKKFYRSKQAIDEHGLGLGLAICEKIITAHHGTIWVESVKNKGTTIFHFTLPISTAPIQK